MSASRTLVVPSQLRALPHACVYCGARTSAPQLARTFTWHHEGWYLTVLLGVIPYLIVAAIVRKKHVLALSLCEAHRKARLRRMLVGYVGLPFFGVALLAGAAFIPGVSFALTSGVSVTCIAAGVMVGRRARHVLEVIRIDARDTRLRNVSREILEAGVEQVARVFE
jgi:hypothetical protein